MAPRPVTPIGYMPLHYDAKGADRRQHPGVIPVELVPVPRLEHQVAVLATREVEVGSEDVTQVRGPVARLSFAFSSVLVSIACVIVTAARC